MNNDFEISTSSGVFATSAGMQGGDSYSVKRTTSFSSIHQEVSQSLFSDQQQAPFASSTFISRRNTERDDQLDDNNTATGQEKPGSPVGDMLLPLLAMAMIYVFVKLFRNHKTSHTL